MNAVTSVRMAIIDRVLARHSVTQIAGTAARVEEKSTVVATSVGDVSFLNTPHHTSMLVVWLYRELSRLMARRDPALLANVFRREVWSVHDRTFLRVLLLVVGTTVFLVAVFPTLWWLWLFACALIVAFKLCALPYNWSQTLKYDVAVSVWSTERMLEHGEHIAIAHQFLNRLYSPSIDAETRIVLDCRIAFLKRRGWTVRYLRGSISAATATATATGTTTATTRTLAPSGNYQISVELVHAQGHGVVIVSPNEDDIECFAMLAHSMTHRIDNSII